MHSVKETYMNIFLLFVKFTNRLALIALMLCRKKNMANFHIRI